MASSEDQLFVDDCWNRIGVWGNETPRCPKLKQYTHCQNCYVYAHSGRQLLRRDVPAGYVDDWTKNLSAKKLREAEQGEYESVTVFRLGDEWFALNTGLFEEVTEMGPIHGIPHRRDRVIRGLTSVRGDLQICVSLGYLLGVQKGVKKPKDATNKSRERLVVIHRDGQRFVFPTSEIRGILHYLPNQLRNPPSTASRSNDAYVKGVIEHDDFMLACLDAELLFHGLVRALR